MNRNKRYDLERQIDNVKRTIQKIEKQNIESKEICECVETLANVVDLIISEF